MCRIGGDEFVVLTDPLAFGEDLTLIAERLREVLSAPFVISGQTISITISVGISTADDLEIEARH